MTRGTLYEVLGSASSITAVTTQEVITGDMPPNKTKHFILMTIGKGIMQVDNKLIEIDTAPINQDGRVMVPIRSIIETMNGYAEWNGTERKIILNANGHEVVMWLDRKDIITDGVAKQMDITPKVVNGRTMLPIRFVVENIGCKVDWIGSTQQVVIVYYD